MAFDYQQLIIQKLCDSYGIVSVLDDHPPGEASRDFYFILTVSSQAV